MKQAKEVMSAAMVQPGYYKGKERYGSFDYYYVVDFQGDNERMWGNYTGSHSMYWGINLSAGFWVEAGELFVDDLFHASPQYIGSEAPDDVPPFHGDVVASESDQDRMFKDVIAKVESEHPEYFEAQKAARPIDKRAKVEEKKMTSNAELQKVLNNIQVPKIEEGTDNAEDREYLRQLEAALLNSTSASPECECMVCDLPLEVKHEKVQWSVALWFPGPYPKPGEAQMLLCDHCKNDWLDGEWDERNGNYVVIEVSKIGEDN